MALSMETMTDEQYPPVANTHQVFFAGAAVAYGVLLGIVQQLDEPKAASMQTLLREILIQSPQRFWLRFWTR